MKITKDIILEVRGMLERKWDVLEIASKMNIDPDDIRMIIDIVNNLFT